MSRHTVVLLASRRFDATIKVLPLPSCNGIYAIDRPAPGVVLHITVLVKGAHFYIGLCSLMVKARYFEINSRNTPQRNLRFESQRAPIIFIFFERGHLFVVVCRRVSEFES
jgi:hypothetical protein